MREINFIKINKTLNELENDFIKEFTFIRKTNNLTQQLLADYSKTSREKIARIESKMHSPNLKSLIKILGSIGYTIKIEKIK
jgi:transcriptional regulator with XRE-family HTH domain